MFSCTSIPSFSASVARPPTAISIKVGKFLISADTSTEFGGSGGVGSAIAGEDTDSFGVSGGDLRVHAPNAIRSSNTAPRFLNLIVVPILSQQDRESGSSYGNISPERKRERSPNDWTRSGSHGTAEAVRFRRDHFQEYRRQPGPSSRHLTRCACTSSLPDSPSAGSDVRRLDSDPATCRLRLVP